MKFLDVKTDNVGHLDYIPKNVNQELQKAFNIANEANLSEEELDLQHKKRDWIYIQKSSIEFATKTGLEQGEWKEKMKIIENADRIGLPMQTIMELTGLDEEKIMSLLPKKS